MRALTTTSSPLDHLARIFSRVIFSRASLGPRARSRPPRLVGSFTLTYRTNTNANISVPTSQSLLFIAGGATISQQMVRTIVLHKQPRRDYGNNRRLWRFATFTWATSVTSRHSYVHFYIIYLLQCNRIFQDHSLGYVKFSAVSERAVPMKL